MRRSRKVVLVAAVVGIGVATAGVTLPRSHPADPPDPPTPPVSAEDPVPTFEVRSSTRGVVSVPLATAGSVVPGGQPFNPGTQAEAARGLAEPAPAAPDATVTQAGVESIIGRDDRVWLRGRTGVYPNSALGRIDFRQDGRTYWCTGTLIDADTVLTAGHCLHDGLGQESGWSTRVKFLPGVEGNRAPFGTCGARELLTLPRWYTDGAEYQDLGLIQLNCSIGDVVGWFGYRAVPGRTALNRYPVHLRGYPGDKVWGSLWTTRDRIAVSQAQMVFYAADTYGGQSGAPLFNYRQCNGVRGPCVLAVHSYMTHGRGPHRSYNHGPRLDETRVALIDALARPAG
jgi:glutamyl endopeptidase